MHTNITVARLATRARTWVLMAGLTALLVGIGAAVGGGALYLFAAFAVLMNLAGYWFSAKIALARLKALTAEPSPQPAGTVP
jgi:heat shock protein HtpX